MSKATQGHSSNEEKRKECIYWPYMRRQFVDLLAVLWANKGQLSAVPDNPLLLGLLRLLAVDAGGA